MSDCHHDNRGVSGFALIVVLFILLIIVGASFVGGACCGPVAPIAPAYGYPSYC
ncbi:YjcZ family sporulation protein [Peribacillus alkalitolerans]|uniref:YjcZ family sporulation protein n=1 Tax=Peribacillus alkalitolerans TaxID=1550385 RepID=UPI0013D12722|nr:YjcZ family sporulation protein [Peribacillus alkalitolerans]